MVAEAFGAGGGGDVHAYLDKHDAKELVRFVAIGSVDDGKSTLIGRLLHDTRCVYEDQLAAARRASRGGGALDLSLLTDGLRAEREQRITIDVAYRYFSTDKRKLILADTPGHEQYTRNMATGASTADVAVVLVDVRHGVVAQTRRHAAIASLLGIPTLVVAVNKMDLAAYSEDAFRRVERSFGAALERLSFDRVQLVPVSAVLGDNVVRRSEHTRWYDGPTLLELLETLPVASGDRAGPTRFPVQLALRPSLDYRAFAGSVARGTVRPGDELVALPSGQRARVRSIDTFEGPLALAVPPLSVALRLDREIDLGRGDLLAAAAAPPDSALEVRASLVWLSEEPFDGRRRLLAKHTTSTVAARVEAVEGALSLETMEVVPREGIALNDIVRARVSFARPIFCDRYRDNRAMGAFILVDAVSNATVAAGMIEGSTVLATGDRATGRVTEAERRERLGHVGLVVSAKSHERATELERALWERGVVAAVASPATAADLAGAGVVALVGGPAEGAFEAEPAALGAASAGEVASRIARRVGLA